MPTYTTNYDLAKPLPNDPTDMDLWGGYLNDDMDKIDAALTNAGQLPVGSLYFNASVATNPATLLGYGTWTAFGEGRVILGVGTGTDGNGDTLAVANAATGGEYNHTLITAELATHGHTVTDAGHTHNVMLKNGGGGGTGGSEIPSTTTSNVVTQSATTGISINNAGSGTKHNNTQPYIGVYVWLRSA